MKRLKPYLSALLLFLLLYPLGEKTLHGLSHLSEVPCGMEETHFCQAEHHCHLCDYVFSPCTSAGITGDHLRLFSLRGEGYQPLPDVPLSLSSVTLFFLRGPPAAL